MKTYIYTSWIILLVTALILVAGNMLEKRSKFVSKYLKMELKSFNLVFGAGGILISLINYIAMEYFGSWKTMIIIVAIFIAVVYAIVYFAKKNKAKD